MELRRPVSSAMIVGDKKEMQSVTSQPPLREEGSARWTAPESGVRRHQSDNMALAVGLSFGKNIETYFVQVFIYILLLKK